MNTILSLRTMVLGAFVVWLVVAAIIALGVYFITTRAVVFARATFSLCYAIVLNQQYTLVPGGGFLNFLAWAMVVFGIVYLLCLLPRVDIAFQFSCTMTVSLVVCIAFASLFGSLFFQQDELLLPYEIAIKLACIGVSVGMLALQDKKLPSESSSNLLVRNLDRLLASVLYGFCCIILINSISGNWTTPNILQAVGFLGGIAVTFVADIFFADKLLFGFPTPDNTEDTTA